MFVLRTTSVTRNTVFSSPEFRDFTTLMSDHVPQQHVPVRARTGTCIRCTPQSVFMTYMHQDFATRTAVTSDMIQSDSHRVSLSGRPQGDGRLGTPGRPFYHTCIIDYNFFTTRVQS